MAVQEPELLPILKALRAYIVKEYGVNYPPHVRGEDASAKDMPADWVDKLNPITGGESEGRAEYGSSGSNTTKGASQGEDPYIHKSELKELLEDFAKHVVDGQDVQQSGSRGDNAGFQYPGEAGRITTNRGLEMQDDDEEELEIGDEEEEEEVEEDIEKNEHLEEGDPDEEDEDEGLDKEGGEYGMQMGHGSQGVGAILKDIKDLMVARSQDKAQYADIKKDLAAIKKSVPVEIRNGIKRGLRGFGMEPSRTDVQTRTEDRTIFADTPSQALMPDQRIGVEGESFAKSDEEKVQEDFTDAIQTIVDKHDMNDLRGTFKMVNGMRNQTGELTPQTLYYYPQNKKGGAK